MERRIGWSVSLTSNAYYWWSYGDPGKESMNQIPPLIFFVQFSGLKRWGKDVLNSTKICFATFGADAPSPLSTSAQDRSSFSVDERLGLVGDMQPGGWRSPPNVNRFLKLDILDTPYLVTNKSR